MKKYKFVEPQVTRREIAQTLIRTLDRELTEQEVKVIYWLGDAEYETRGVLLDLFKELAEKAGE